MKLHNPHASLSQQILRQQILRQQILRRSKQSAEQSVASSTQQSVASSTQQSVASSARQSVASSAQQSATSSAQQSAASSAQQSATSSAQQSATSSAQHAASPHQAARRAGVQSRSSSRSNSQNCNSLDDEDDSALQNLIYAEEAKVTKVKQKDDSGGGQEQGGQKGEGDLSKNLRLHDQFESKEVFAGSIRKTDRSLQVFGSSPVIAENLMTRRVEKKLVEQKPQAPSKDVFGALRNAQRPGIFLRSHDMEKDGAVSPKLQSAVQEAHTLLPTLPGIVGIGPGYNEENEGTIVMVAGRHLSLKTIQTIPRQVGGFRTTVSLQYDFLPLKSE